MDDRQQAHDQCRPPHRARAGADLHDRPPTSREFGIEFGFKDKLAPRAGFAYDIKGDGKWKAFGSWGVFYDIFKLELPRGSFGGDKWLDYYYTLDTLDWSNLLANSRPARRHARAPHQRPDRLPSPVVRIGLDRDRT